MRRTARVAACVLACALGAACADRTPAAPGVDSGPPPPQTVAQLRCTAQVRTGSVACSAGAASSGARGVILGGQGLNVRLSSSGTHYDAGTSTLITQVTVQNLTGQVLGSRDGVNATVEGVRVFFHSGPTVTVGTGTVSVTNADGAEAYTAAQQPYFRYAGPVAPGDTTPPREWRFGVPGTVETFVFTLLVAAPVYREAGWVSVTPVAPSLAVGDTMRMTGVLHAVTGRGGDGPALRWWSSNPAVATVDSTGVVTALVQGAAVITATSGDRAGSATLQVSADAPFTRPTLVSVDITPGTPVIADVDTVTIRVRVRYLHTSFYLMKINLHSALNGDAWPCSGIELVSGTAEDGVYECRMVMPYWMAAGAWQIDTIELYTSSRSRVVSAAALRAAGAPWRIQVKNAYDAEAPRLDSLSVPQPDAVANTVRPAIVNVSATDTGLGIGRIRVIARSDRNGARAQCENGVPAISATSATYPCYLNFPPYAATGTWTLEEVMLEDVAGNRRTFTTAALQALGYPTAVTVSGAQEDTTPAAVTGLAIAPATVAANTADSAAVSVSATDDRSGVGTIVAVLARVGGAQTRQCSMVVSPSGVTSATRSCAFRFNATETGTWTMQSLFIFDWAGNTATLSTAELSAAGYPTQITVTP